MAPKACWDKPAALRILAIFFGMLLMNRTINELFIICQVEFRLTIDKRYVYIQPESKYTKGEGLNMIEWSKALPDMEKIHQIAKRASALFPQIDFVFLSMDITAAHLDCPMNLDDLLGARDEDFFHDVAGIVSNINRETGKIENCFCPRYARRSEGTA